MLSIVLSTPSNAASAVPPCLILAMRVASQFGALQARFYKERIYLQDLKTFKQRKVEVQEFSVRWSDTPHILVAGFAGFSAY
jgi:hypothetical protein